MWKPRNVSRRKTRKKIPLSIGLPPQRIRQNFLLIYELEGCQKAVNYLTKYYGTRRMRIFLNGRKVGKGCVGCYFENCAYLKKEGLNKRTVLHELYHHLIFSNGLKLSIKLEEMEANNYARKLS